ncbi:MAG TPA: DUF3813 family protein [Bacillota bacterium]|nr:DUF3813 family protein [Bacillota bacterium]
MFEQAKEAMNEFFNNRNEGQAEDKDKEIVQQAIQEAYKHSSTEEREQLDLLEKQLTKTK